MLINFLFKYFMTFSMSFIFFWTISSLLSAIYSFNPIYNEFEVGFPYTYYLQFQVSGNEFVNSSWFRDGLKGNIFCYSVLSLIFVIIKLLVGKNKNNI